MTASRCDRCLVELPQGAPRFDARLRLTGETGGVPAEDLQGAHASTENALEDALRAAENLSEDDLLASVVEEFRFTLCPSCRARLRDDPAGAGNTRPAARRMLQ